MGFGNKNRIISTFPARSIGKKLEKKQNKNFSVFSRTSSQRIKFDQNPQKLERSNGGEGARLRYTGWESAHVRGSHKNQ